MLKNIGGIFLLATIFSCANNKAANSNSSMASLAIDTLPAPFATPSARNNSKIIAWPENKTPVAPAGFTVTKFADALDHPRWIYVAANGDVFIAESNTASRNRSANRITLFRDSNKDGVVESRRVFAQNLNHPLGMLTLNNSFYVANTDGLMQFDYKMGDTALTGEGKKLYRCRRVVTTTTGREI